MINIPDNSDLQELQEQIAALEERLGVDLVRTSKTHGTGYVAVDRNGVLSKLEDQYNRRTQFLE
jgi:hypothetical protein